MWRDGSSARRKVRGAAAAVATVWLGTAILLGCAHDERLRDELSALQSRSAEQGRQITDLNVRLEEMNNRLILLQDRVTAREKTEKGEEVVPVLPKVKLVPEESKSSALTKSPATDTKEKAQSAGEGNPFVRVARVAPRNEYVEEYDRALESYKAGRYADAGKQFDAFLERFPGTDYSDNAAYWSGMALYMQGDYRKALARLSEVLDYPDSNKAADALFQIGMCHKALGDERTAGQAWTQLAERYPNSEAARRVSPP